ncbi:MAG: 2-C-methyl-D-erythritol 4-phosphate cytidylyltransferase [Oscillospiraceae bacterium]|nr:2-C-methyl-D-erythritol 4-phosphate cytidylyltransferase [Oscillospiraceae bacterium]
MKLLDLYQKVRKEEKPLKCGVVIVAAGSSQRMGFDKLTVMLDGVPVLIRAVNAFDQSPFTDEIAVVTRQERLQEIADLCKQYNITKISSVVCGGKSRTESVYAGVMALKKDNRLIAVHDGARPFVSQKLIELCVRKAGAQYAAIPVLRSTDSLRGIDSRGSLTKSLDRDTVVRVQTPQVFQAEILKAALCDAVEKGLNFTDDASAVERLGMTLQGVEGEEENLKLTTPQDLVIARGILERRKGEQI